MRFWQKYQYTEYLFGMQNILFAVSDNPSELFQDGAGIQTDIFLLESVKKDLNTEEGSFAIDELSFFVNQPSCQSDDDLNAMFFVLDATNIKINRYCAVFFGDVAAIDNLLFYGKISDKVSGTDKVWVGGDYSFFIDPKREYKFSAYSFDVSILEQVKLTGKIENLEGVLIDNIYQRLEENNWAAIKALFHYRLSYTIDNVNNPNVYICPLASLNRVLQLYLDKASDVIQELTGTYVSLVFRPSSLGIQTSPVIIKLTKETDTEVEELKIDGSKRIELRFSFDDDAKPDEGWSVPFIHRKLIAPELGNSQQKDWQKNQVASETAYSFKSLNNMSELLFEVARSFGCYLFATYNTGASINIEFKSRKSLIESEYTYIIGAEEASIDTSSIITKEPNEFYGLANNFATDEYDEIVNKVNTSEPQPTQKFLDASNERKYKEEKKGTKFERLLLTTSLTMHIMYSGDKDLGHASMKVPINISRNQNWEQTILQTFVKAGSGGSSSSTTERIHTGIYVATTVNPEEEQTQWNRIGNTRIYRPASRIYAKINNENLYFNSLAKYVNFILARDKQYYETEYSLTVPFWNGFSKDENGSGASWKEIKLGSKVKLAENVTRYINNNWQTQVVQRDYVVVGIEINLQKPETKLKLHNLERFAFGWWDGNAGMLPTSIFAGSEISFPTGGGVVIRNYEIETGEEILAGDAVMLLDTGKIAKTKSLSNYQHRTIGIAKESGTSGSTIPVQIGGQIYYEGYSFTNIGGQVFARTNAMQGLNVTQSILASPNSEEDMIICLGKADSEKSFILDIIEFPFESGVQL